MRKVIRELNRLSFFVPFLAVSNTEFARQKVSKIFVCENRLRL